MAHPVWPAVSFDVYYVVIEACDSVSWRCQLEVFLSACLGYTIFIKS